MLVILFLIRLFKLGDYTIQYDAPNAYDKSNSDCVINLGSDNEFNIIKSQQ